MEKIFYIICVSILVAISLGACANKNKQEDSLSSVEKSSDSSLSTIKYAEGFTVIEGDGYKLIDIHDPQGKSDVLYRYALVDRESGNIDIPADYQVIKVPIQSAICMTNLQLANFIKLDAIDRIVGLTSTNYLFNEEIKERIANSKTSKIGIEGNFDSELILALNPDVILVSPFKKGGYESIKNLDIPLVTFLGYKETTPLGQAEWMKFVAMLIGKEDEANKLFSAIEKRYNELRELASTIDKHPTVLSGEMHSGNWYVVGGKSYLAEQIRDAGGSYFMKNDEETGGFHLDFESVYAQGANADFWRLLVSHTGDYSYDVLKQSDSRYTDFEAYKNKKVVYCNLRQKPFYEKAPVEPEVILADMIKAFHPDLLPNHQPVYYELLK